MTDVLTAAGSRGLLGGRRHPGLGRVRSPPGHRPASPARTPEGPPSQPDRRPWKRKQMNESTTHPNTHRDTQPQLRLRR